MNTYYEMIRALKDFHEAKENLARAEKNWDDVRYNLVPQWDGEKSFMYFYLESEYLGNRARDFLHAYNVYQHLGAPIIIKRKDTTCPDDLWKYSVSMGYVIPLEDDDE
jgi:hypothetical protein